MRRAFCFFFQAEDGIRDHCVTGVQTCALPIFGSRSKTLRRCFTWIESQIVRKLEGCKPDVIGLGGIITQYRSEERRVGKECRSRWSAEAYGKKQHNEENNHAASQANERARAAD